jgi:MerR family transcriptional regulator, light-induced transcriptional regulator
VPDVSNEPSGVPTNEAPDGEVGRRSGYLRSSDDGNLSERPLDDRHLRLVDVVAQSVIPELLEKFDIPLELSDHALIHAGQSDVMRLAQIVVGTNDAATVAFLEALRARGLSLDELHQELLEPTARRLGDLWNNDQLDFFDVTIGVGRLQRMVHYFARLDQIPAYDERRRVFLAETPGESHSFGMSIVSRFLVAGGWNVQSDNHLSINAIEDALSKEWFGVVGFSLGVENHVDRLAELVEKVRKSSHNRSIGIMVGGPAFIDDPALVDQVGADGMATNGPSAVILAKKLLAKSLVASK